jgi:hypothetical protein
MTTAREWVDLAIQGAVPAMVLVLIGWFLVWLYYKDG